MKLGTGLFWGMLVVLIGLVNVVSAFLGVNLPTVDLEELAWHWGDDAGFPEGC